MIYKCKNCGGNAVYSPSRSRMYCPYCDGVDCEEAAENRSMDVCANCGAPMDAGDYTSAVKCEYCGHYTIFEQRIEGEYEPGLILPFKLDKDAAVEKMKADFKHRVFAPESFLSQSTLEKMEGTYVPMWLYDMKADCQYRGTGTKIRVWNDGDTEFTETSYYAVAREQDVEFEKIPVDASAAMDDRTMDLLEPYSYAALEQFDAKYMSGFLSEVYNYPAQQLGGRAEEVARKDASMMLHNTLNGYTALIPEYENVSLQPRQAQYALLPVWLYRYSYQLKHGDPVKILDFYVNGQNGKVIGKAPVSWQRVLAYGGTMFASMSMILLLIRAILGGIL